MSTWHKKLLRILVHESGAHGTYNLEPTSFSSDEGMAHEKRFKILSLTLSMDGDGRVSVTIIHSPKRMRDHCPGDYSYIHLLMDNRQVSPR
jgi:hypothetical protein